MCVYVCVCVCVSEGESERAKPERGSPGKPQTSVSFSSYLCVSCWYFFHHFSGCFAPQSRGLVCRASGDTLADQQQLVQCYTVTGVQ